MISRVSAVIGAACVALAVAGCDDKPSPNAAPTATALTAEKPASAGAKPFAIDKASSKAGFEMAAPIEKIRGRADHATQGTLQIDPTDLTKTTGVITVDISGLELFQTVSTDAGPGAESKSDLQNEHARAWLQIAPDAPEAERAKNVLVNFSIKSVDKASEKDVTKMPGADRKVTLTVTGDVLVHGHKTTKVAELEAVFHGEGNQITSVDVKTVKPLPIGLEENDIRPRTTFETLAQRTLGDLADKVAKDALVSVEFTAKAGNSAPAHGDASAKPAAP